MSSGLLVATALLVAAVPSQEDTKDARPPFVLSAEIAPQARSKYKFREQHEVHEDASLVMEFTMTRVCEEKIVRRNADGYVVEWKLGKPEFTPDDPDDLRAHAASIASKLAPIEVEVYRDARSAKTNEEVLALFMKKVEVPAKAYKSTPEERKNLRGSPFAEMSDDFEKVRKQKYVLDRTMSFWKGVASFMETFYRRPTQTLAMGASFTLTADHHFFGTPRIPTKWTFSVTAQDESTVTIDGASQVDSEAVARLIDEIVADTSFPKQTLKQSNETPAQVVRRLASALDETATYTLDAKTGWPVAIEYQEKNWDDAVRLRTVRISVERLPDPSKK